MDIIDKMQTLPPDVARKEALEMKRRKWWEET